MNSEIIWISLTAIASWALVFVTWRMVSKQIKATQEDLHEQIKVARDGMNQQLQMARDDLKVRLQITYEEKFDSPSLILERKKLAKQILANATHSEIQDALLNFFESIGMLLRRGYFDIDMAWSAFSFYSERWWSATKDYIIEERRRENSDDTIFEEFELLVNAMYTFEIEKRHLSRAQLEPSKQDLLRFLENEANL
ncbi:MAG: DUF4760 domain-containing protein [Bacteroidota bacterium]|jgi:hypothetical protein